MKVHSIKSLRLGVVTAVLLGLVGSGFGIFQFVIDMELLQEIASV
jgi:hypothetical protein